MFISRPIIHQTLAITPAAFANFITGISWGWLSPVLRKYKNSNGELSFSDEDSLWMVSAQNFGYFMGCVILTLVSDRLGRKFVILSSAVIALLSWIGVSLTKKIILLQLSRLIAGISMGINNVILSIYIGENCSPKVRGVFNSGACLFTDVGMIMSSTLITYYSYDISAYIIVAASLVNLSSGILLQEPAQHLLTRGREGNAESRFFWLRGKNEDTKKEFDDIKTNLNEEKPKFSLNFVCNRQFQIVGVISVFAVLTGYPPLLCLVSIIFFPTKQFSPNELAILFNIFQLVASIISPFVIDRFKRRLQWILSAILIIISHIFTAALYICKEKRFEIPNFEWLLFASITAYGMIYSTFTYPLAMVARVELLPRKFRTIGISTLSIISSIMYVIEGHCFLWVASSFGIEINFIFFALSGLIILVCCYFYLPETKGMALTDIEKVLENSMK